MIIDFGLVEYLDAKHKLKKLAMDPDYPSYPPELVELRRPLPTSDLYAISHHMIEIGEDTKSTILENVGRTLQEQAWSKRWSHEEVRDQLDK